MLILTRKLGEAINIGDQVKILILDVKGKQVRLGIEAPKDMSIHREEVYLKIQSANVQAAEKSPDSLSFVSDAWNKKD